MKSTINAVTPGPLTPRTSSFQRPTPSTLPINLSLSEDERSPSRSKSDSISPHLSKTTAANHSATHNIDDDEEELYEYFPLSLDDWYAYSLSLSSCSYREEVPSAVDPIWCHDLVYFVHGI